MAQVPEYGLSQIAPNEGVRSGFDLEIPRVDIATPMNRAADDLNATMRKAAEQIDAARVAKADAELTMYLREQQYGDDGFMKLKGENALAPDQDGGSLQDRVLKGVDDKIQELSETLSPRQKDLFIRSSQSKRASQFGVVSQHVYQESQEFIVRSHNAKAEAAAESARLSYANPDALAQSIGQTLEATEALAEIQGMDDTMRANLRRKAIDNVVMNMANGAIMASDTDANAAANAYAAVNRYAKYLTPSKAQEMRQKLSSIMDSKAQDKLLEDDSLTNRPPAVLEIGGKVLINPDGSVNKNELDSATNKIYDALVMNLSGGFHYDKYGKVRNDNGRFGMGLLSEDAAKKAAEALGIDWEAEGKGFKEAGGDIMADRLGRRHLRDLLEESEGNVRLAVASYLGGDKITQESLGKADTVMEALVGENDGAIYENGKRISSFDARGAASNASHFYTIDEFRQQIALRAENGDATCLRAMSDKRFMQRLEAKFLKQRDAKEKAYKEQKNADFAQAIDLIDQGKDIPTELWERFTRAEQDDLTRISEKRATDDTSGDLESAIFLATHPETYLYLSEAAMKVRTADCPKVQRDQLRRAWYDNRMRLITDTNAQGRLTAEAERGNIRFDYYVKRESLNSAFRALDPDTYAKMDKDGTLQGFLTVAGEAIANDNQIRGVLGKNMTQKDLELHVERLLATSFKNDGGVDTRVLNIKKAGGIPNNGAGDVYDICKKLVQLRKGATLPSQMPVTDGEIFEQFYRMMLVPNFNVPSEILPYMEDSYRRSRDEAGAGHTTTWYVRNWVKERLAGKQLPTPTGERLDMLDAQLFAGDERVVEGDENGLR